MATAKRFTTPSGVAVYPKLVVADTKYNIEGEYKTSLRLPADATIGGEPLIAFLEKHCAASMVKHQAEEDVKARAKNKKPKPIKAGVEPYEVDEETNEIIVKFKLKATGMTRDKVVFTQKPALFDAKGTPYKGKEIWGGSVIKVAFEVVPYFTVLIGAGISLRLKAAQIIELKQGSSDGSSFGFGEEEGYETSEEDNIPPFSMDDSEQSTPEGSGDF